MKIFILLALFPYCLFAAITGSTLPALEAVYQKSFTGRVSPEQEQAMKEAVSEVGRAIRVMSYNMLYNAPEAEKELEPVNRWENRRGRLESYLRFANADLIGSQELQEDQLKEVARFLESDYSYYGEKTREGENRSDINAIFYRKSRFELLEGRTIPYPGKALSNGFTYCRLRDRTGGQELAMINTKLTFSSPERRLKEVYAIQQFVRELPERLALIVVGDFNAFPFLNDERSPFCDGDFLIRKLEATPLEEAKRASLFGHFGPLCSLTNCIKTFKPFIGPELTGAIFDYIFVNQRVAVLSHTIDPAKVDGHFPSDHLPVLSDIVLKESSA